MTSKVIFALAAVTIFFSVFSVVVLMAITGNFYTAAYYTISALFDAVGIAPGGVPLSTSAPNFSTPFYALVTLSIADGIVKIVIVGVVIASMINIVTAFDVKARIAAITRRDWKDHVVICGYSFLAEKVAAELMERDIPFLIIDRNLAKSDMIKDEGYTALHEDFTTDLSLKNAHIQHARAVMFLTENDYDNLLGVVTARHLSPTVKIIARAGDSNTITKIHRAGAELCVVPEVLAGLEIGEAIVAKKW